MCRWNFGCGELKADRHVVACEDERQHDENRMSDIRIGTRRSEISHREQPDKLRKTVKSQRELSNSASASAMHVSLEYPASGERQYRPDPVLVVQKSGRVDDDTHFCVVCIYKMDVRKSRCTKRCSIGIEMKMSEISEEIH